MQNYPPLHTISSVETLISEIT